MGPLKRMIRYLRALIMGKMDEWEDPEIILSEAVREMKENQIKNRELAVQAVTQKHNLQAEVDRSERLVADCEKKAMQALQTGNRELARQFMKEKAIQEQTLVSMRQNLASAIESAEKVKQAIQQEEQQIRAKTSEALAMKANLKQAQIQIRLNKAMEGMVFSDNANNWSAVQDRIQSMQSEATARAEVTSTSMDSKVQQMEMAGMDAEADRQLAELEAKMSLGGNPAAAYTTSQQQQTQSVGAGSSATAGNGAASPVESEIDRQLRELESKLGGQK
ncbi:MAG: PspA/IM30 family protein [Armatimonadetes bacterium]|nr:PspA/IM30 family protein [Armatimonadota bacterium]MDE2207499.1 PspA/IM30 family protein [Armatimonadota bacterium]